MTLVCKSFVSFYILLLRFDVSMYRLDDDLPKLYSSESAAFAVYKYTRNLVSSKNIENRMRVGLGFYFTRFQIQMVA